VWPHQLALSKGGKLGFKLVFEMYNIFLCSDNPKLLRQIEVNSAAMHNVGPNMADFATFIRDCVISVTGKYDVTEKTQ